MKKNKKRRLVVDHSARRAQRAEMINNGLWMGRNCIHKSAVDYNRQQAKLETRKLVDSE